MPPTEEELKAYFNRCKPICRQDLTLTLMWLRDALENRNDEFIGDLNMLGMENIEKIDKLINMLGEKKADVEGLLIAQMGKQPPKENVGIELQGAPDIAKAMAAASTWRKAVLKCQKITDKQWKSKLVSRIGNLQSEREKAKKSHEKTEGEIAAEETKEQPGA